MRNTHFAIPLAIGILLPLVAPAQGMLQVSNLNQSPTGSAAIGSDSWIAQNFAIRAPDANPYVLESIQLLMNPASGDPDEFSISIYSAPFGSFTPQTHLGSLNGSMNPSTGGVYTYGSPGIVLLSGFNYFVLVTAGTPVAEASYTWSAANSFTTDGSWYINNIYLSSPDGLNWTPHIRSEVFQMAIYATVIPEPTTFTLLGLGLAALGLWWRRR
jgi:hypothetical protein